MAWLFNARKRLGMLSYYEGRKLHSKDTLDAWDEYDKFCQMKEDVRLPSLTESNENPVDLERLRVRVNYSKTIIGATATMALASGFQIKNANGDRDEKSEKLFKKGDLRRLVDHMSRYGAGWFHILHSDPFKPYRIHKPHVAAEIYDEDDPERPRGVVFMQKYESLPEGEGLPPETYWLARIYEWNTEYTQVRMYEYRKQLSGGRISGAAEWRLTDRTPVDKPKTFSYMPMRLCVNHPEVDRDRLYEASDLFAGVPLFKIYNEVVTKLNKALEDEAFRQTFFAGVDAKAMKQMTRHGPTTFLYFRDGDPQRPLAQMQVAPPSDVRQFIEVMNRYIKTIATVTRTAPPELDERPVQDIPAQTLRVLYNPQIERVRDTVEVLREALADSSQIISSGGTFDRKKPWSTTMEPEVPMSEDKRVQEDQGLYNTNSLSSVEMLMRTKRYSRSEAERIIAEREAEDRRRAQMEAEVQRDSEVAVEGVKGENQLKLEQERQKAPAPTGGFGA